MTKLKISVTKEILEKSRHCSNGESQGFNCAVALSIRDIFPTAYCFQSVLLFFEEDLIDWRRRGLFSGLSKYPHAIFPPAVFSWIKEFDNSTPEERITMQPISFEIEIPDAVIEQINIDELRPLLTNHPTIELV